MSITLFVIIGLVSGWVANELMVRRGFGLVGDMSLGVIGAVVGGFVFNSFGTPTFGFWSEVGRSLIGAIVVLFVAALFPHKRGPSALGRL